MSPNQRIHVEHTRARGTNEKSKDVCLRVTTAIVRYTTDACRDRGASSMFKGSLSEQRYSPPSPKTDT